MNSYLYFKKLIFVKPHPVKKNRQIKTGRRKKLGNSPVKQIYLYKEINRSITILFVSFYPFFSSQRTNLNPWKLFKRDPLELKLTKSQIYHL